MKTKLLVLLLPFLLISGCVSQGVKPATADVVSAVVRPIAKNAVNLVLAKNPHYDDALLALATAADVAINGGELDVMTIKAFVDTLALRYQIDPETKIILASAIDDVLHAYQDIYGTDNLSGTDPNVRKYLSAFARGIREGIAFRKSMISP